MRSGMSDIGNLYGLLDQYSKTGGREYSWLSGKWNDVDQWKTAARAKILELLGYFPEEAPLDPAVLSRHLMNGCIHEEVEFNTARDTRVRGTMLLPNGAQGKLPAVIAIHCHSGFYYFGREKIVEQEDEPDILTRFKQRRYGGRSWACELCRRGYAVLCIDGFYFGTRKLDLHNVPPEVISMLSTESLDWLHEGSDEYIDAYNRIQEKFEALVAKHILVSGTTWPGLLLHDDRKCVDYLRTRTEVDSSRIGCCGLSIGGFRSAHLAALDHRISCSVVTGWMPTYRSLLFNGLRVHTNMVYVPTLPRFMDLPDVLSLTAPNPLLVQQCSQDRLYNMEGMEEACFKIDDVYCRLGRPERYRYEFYDNGH
jgi:dienelactone hydrolase